MNWEQFAIQIPIVAAFIWYSLEMQKRFQISMDKRDEAYLKALAAITESIDCHDEKVESRINSAVAAINTRPIGRQTK